MSEAPCGDTFDTPDDARGHEIVCGACAGALELAATVTVVTCFVASTPTKFETATFAVFTTPERAREWIIEDINHTFGHFDHFDESDDYQARRMFAAEWGVSYAIDTADLDPADPGN